MKPAFASVVICVASLPLLGQSPNTRAEIVQRICHAPEVTSGNEVERIKSIEQRLGPVLKEMPAPRIHVAIVESGVINAWNQNLNPRESLICIPVGLFRFMGDGEGEMAFIFAHETGHAIDTACKTSTGRAEVTPPTLSGALDRLLGGSGRNALAENRTCEARADAIGFALFTGAGYNPFDAAGAFGRLEMLSGDISTGAVARLLALGKTHPMTPDRIAHMRGLLMEKAMNAPSTR